MASNRQVLLGRLLDQNSPFVGEEELALAREGGSSESSALKRRFSVGDRASDRLAMQVAMTMPIATAAALALTDQSSRPSSSAPTASWYHPNQAFADEIDRQIAQDKLSPAKKSKYNGWIRREMMAPPGKTVTITLFSDRPIVNPLLHVDSGGSKDDMKTLGVTLGGKPILVGKTTDDLWKGVVMDGMTITKDAPLRVTLQNTNTTKKYDSTFAISVVYVE